MNDALQIGRIGEYLAAAVLEQMGFDVTIIAGKKYDLLVTANEKMYRVQVKSTSRENSTNRARKPSYEFRTSHGSSGKKLYAKGEMDIFALVAIDIRKVLFVAADSITAVTKRVPPADFVGIDSESKSWDQSVAALQAVQVP